jgi:hypothetical protein
MNSFSIWSGETMVDWFPKVASTAYSNNSIVRFNGSGAVAMATNSAGQNPFVGLFIRAAITSAATDYADTTKVPVVIPNSDAIFLAPVVTGTLTTAMVGTYVDLDATSVGINVSSSTQDALLVVGYISATLALVKINSAAQWKPGL